MRYLACIFETKSWWKRCCAWELDEVGDLLSCKWFISLFVGFALGKARAGVGGARCERTDNSRGWGWKHIARRGGLWVGASDRVEESGELGHWSRERPSPGFAAVSRRSGAEGETFAESVSAVVEGDVRAAAEAAMARFPLEEILEFMFLLRGARGCEGSAGNSRDVHGFGEESGEPRLGSYSRSRFVACIWAGKPCVLISQPDMWGQYCFQTVIRWISMGWREETIIGRASGIFPYIAQGSLS